MSFFSGQTKLSRIINKGVSVLTCHYPVQNRTEHRFLTKLRLLVYGNLSFEIKKGGHHSFRSRKTLYIPCN